MSQALQETMSLKHRSAMSHQDSDRDIDRASGGGKHQYIERASGRGKHQYIDRASGGGKHQYIERETGRIKTEKLYADPMIRFIYSSARENSQFLFKMLTSARMSSLLGFLNYDLCLKTRITKGKKLMGALGIDFSECLEDPETLDTGKKIFERKIRYWETRPMPQESSAIVSAADAKVLLGSLEETSRLFLKEKFFDFEDLLGADKKSWLKAFEGGDFAIFRLTPEKYHYNHTPVCGKVLDIYQIPGGYHSCNPAAVVVMATPYSKNKRVVTIIDTDVEGGTRAGLVAMIEVVALMIGDITQCYSENGYDCPQGIGKGMFLRKGQPKSLYRPGSSTDVLIFQKGMVKFSDDLVLNLYHQGVKSRFSKGFGMPLAETDLKVRSQIATVTR
jgi:phosphatidylserine decarboxylase